MIGFEHVGICAKDTMKLKDWYVKLFKFKVVLFINAAQPIFFLSMEDKTMIEIYPAKVKINLITNDTQGIRHIAFVTDDIDKEYKNLMDNDVEIIEQISMMEKGKVRTIYFRDIEGNILHFIQREKKLV